MPDSRNDALKISMGVIPGEESRPKLSRDSLKDIPLAFATCSIGYNEQHTLPKKIDAIAAAGFNAIELSMPDIVSFANQYLKTDGPVEQGDYDDLYKAAKEIGSMCSSKGLQIYMMQPFANFEGWRKGSTQRKEAFERAEGWIRIMQACACDMLQVGSTDSPESEINTNRDEIVVDLQELADMLAKHNFKLAYENWCWSTHAPDWDDVWDICQKVDRENFGLCLDTFQSAGKEWADPTTKSGMLEDGRSTEQITKDWQASCQRLAETVPAEKIFVLQISDGYRPAKPISTETIDGVRSRKRWSNDFRPLPFEGYLPVVEFTRAVLKTGFRGWFSYEPFDHSGPDGKGKEYALGNYAQDGMEAQRKLMDACAES
jgi:sugar phosphate isomerase/epimerase